MYAVNDGTSIMWEERGPRSGEAILLVMGHRFGLRMWHPVIAALSKQYRLLLFDNRGVGDSDVPATPWTIGDMAADSLAVMDAAGVDRAHVYGVSLGGAIAQEIAVSAPERVRSLILGCTSGRCLSETTAMGAWARSLLYYVPQPLLMRLSAKLLYGPAGSAANAAKDLAEIDQQRATRRGLQGQARAARSYSSLDRVHKIMAPTLVLHGDCDRVVPVARGRELSERIPHARLEVFKGAGHSFLSDVPDLANRAVLDFLRNTTDGATSAP